MREKSDQRRGFTLVELLVVIGIIAALSALALPMLFKSLKAGRIQKTKSDLQTLSFAIGAFRDDTGDIPRVTLPGSGAYQLCKSLMGPGNARLTIPAPDGAASPPAYNASNQYNTGDIVASGGKFYSAAQPVKGVTPIDTDPVNWRLLPVMPLFGASAQCFMDDGHDGPGFKALVRSAKISGPYLQPGKVLVNNSTFVDGDGNPVLYFTANPSVNGTLKQTNFVGATLAPVKPMPNPLYDCSQNGKLLTLSPDEDIDFNRFGAMLGDIVVHDGQIKSSDNETAATDEKYLLWTAGPDKVFVAPPTSALDKAAIQKSDDVTNFR